MIAVNDNLTGPEFKAGVSPKPSIAMVIENNPDVARYHLMGDIKDGWGLVRFGLYQVDRRGPRQFMAFPVAAGPHPFCPEHTYVPTADKRPPLRSKGRGSHLQVVA